MNSNAHNACVCVCESVCVLSGNAAQLPFPLCTELPFSSVPFRSALRSRHDSDFGGEPCRFCFCCGRCRRLCLGRRLCHCLCQRQQRLRPQQQQQPQHESNAKLQLPEFLIRKCNISEKKRHSSEVLICKVSKQFMGQVLRVFRTNGTLLHSYDYGTMF